MIRQNQNENISNSIFDEFLIQSGGTIRKYRYESYMIPLFNE